MIVDLERHFRSVDRYDATARLSRPAPSSVSSRISSLSSCAEVQKRRPVTPLFAALTHSVSRKSFACHSYANTRDGVSTVAANLARHCNRIFARPLFSKTYKFLFSQPLFLSHPYKTPGGVTLCPCLTPSKLLHYRAHLPPGPRRYSWRFRRSK